MIEPAPAASGPPADDTMLSRTRELAMSAAWNGGLTRSLRTTSVEPVAVIFRGTWSHGHGPDFTDAMIQIGEGAVQSGAVEIHRAASDWVRHGHHLDTRYNTVILHVVARLDMEETRREDGGVVPTVVIDVPDADLFAIDQELPEIWSTLGQSTCAEDLAHREPARLRAAINRLGDQRFSERVARAEGELANEPLPAVLARGLFDAFGYSENREPMRQLANRLIEAGFLARVASAGGDRDVFVQAMLFGTGGFLPLSPGDAHFTRFSHQQVAAIEDRWRHESENDADAPLPPTLWTRARTRPANHPVARLAGLGHVLAQSAGDPANSLVECLRSGSDSVALLRALSGAGGLGQGRAIAITASVVQPVIMAWAHHSGDSELEDAVSQAWAQLPRSEWSRPARRALAQAVGTAPIGPLGERAIQGLLHLDRQLCTPRRCFECPVAAEVIRDRQRQRTADAEKGSIS
jgi:hypothetical protein